MFTNHMLQKAELTRKKGGTSHLVGSYKKVVAGSQNFQDNSLGQLEYHQRKEKVVLNGLKETKREMLMISAGYVFGENQRQEVSNRRNHPKEKKVA